MKRTFFSIVLVLLFTSTITKAQVIESHRLAANALWETYGRNASNPSQMPGAVPVNPGSNIDQLTVAPNYNDLKNGLASLLNNNGGILRFNNTGPATINFNEVIELVPTYQNRDKVRTIVVQGAGITFDGMNNNSIFLIRGSVQMVFQDAVFRNGNFQGQSQANLNNINRVGGGAIEMVQSGPFLSSLRVRNCQFLNNTVSHFQGMGENQNGAAIRFNYGTTGEVFGCTFNNNTAVTGGAIGATSIQRLTIINSTFDSNLSNGYKSTNGYMNVVEGAGALRVDRTVKPLEVYGSSFSRNSANVKVSVMEVFAAPVSGFNPGMPSTNEPTLIVDNCEFENNKYNNYVGASNFERAFFAGCVVFHGNSAKMKMTNTVFNNNDVGQANVRMINNFEFSNCTFANTNFLTTSGAPQQGAVFLQNVPQSGSFNECTFYKNEPRNNGVASDIMFWAGAVPSRVSLNNSIFYRQNTSTNIKQVKAPLMGNGNNQFVPNGNMSSFAEVSTSTSNKTDPNISPNAIVDMCLGTNSLPANIGGLEDCSGTPPNNGGQAPYGGTARAIPGTIESEDFDTGGQGVAYNDADAVNRGGQYRASEGVDIATATGGGHQVGWTSVGEWQEYTVNVASAGTYNAAIVHAGGSGATGAIRIEIDGTDKTGTVSLPPTGGWNTFSTVNKEVTLAAGQQVMKVYTINAGFNLNRVVFTQNSTPPTNTDAPIGSTITIAPVQASWITNTFDNLSARFNEGGIVRPNNTNSGEWEKFVVEAGSNGNVRLKVKNFGAGYKYLTTSGTGASVTGTSGTAAAAQYKWEKVGANTFGLQSVATGKWLQIPQNQNQNVAVLNTNGAQRGAWELFSYTVVGSAAKALDVPSVLEVELYPNPLSPGNTLIINSESNLVSVTIFNLNGAIVHSGRSNQIDIDLASGIYVVQITTDKGVAREKLVVK